MNEVYRLFSTPVFKSEIDKMLCDRAVQSILNLRSLKHGVQQTNNWVSRDDLHELPEFKDLSESILTTVTKILDHVTMIRDSEYFTCMWANVNKVGHQHPQHVHANSFLSGVLYLQLPNGSGKTYFVDPRPATKVLSFEFEKNPNEWLSSNNWGPPPEVGKLIIFPSWLPHGVDFAQTNSEEERISLSFNIMVHAKVEVITRRFSI